MQHLTHLYKIYAQIRDPDLNNNRERMDAPYDVNLLTESLFEQIEDKVEFTKLEKRPIHRTRAVYTQSFHKSCDCICQAPGHKTEATETKKMGERETKWNFMRNWKGAVGDDDYSNKSTYLVNSITSTYSISNIITHCGYTN